MKPGLLPNKRWLKWALLLAAALIAGLSLWAAQLLTADLKREELRKVELWAEAMRALTEADEATDLNLVLLVLNGNHSIPLVVSDSQGRIATHRNLDLSPRTASDSLSQLQAAAARLKAQGQKLRLTLAPSPETGTTSDYMELHYGESRLLRRLALYPYVQLAVVSLFMLLALWALRSSKRAEQNRLWVGLSKETAHQLGTPISSLMAWVDVLRESYPHDPLLPEMASDVQRLERIAERFSKIGSAPSLPITPLWKVVEHTVAYLQRRSSTQVEFVLQCDAPELELPLSPPLLEWVIEVICKNAIDAMQGRGQVTISATQREAWLWLDISDTGRGIARSDFAQVFRPGFTTKPRGWGLGLSLARRIVCDYHHGRIYVLHSEVGVGTTFRIELPLCPRL